MRPLIGITSLMEVDEANYIAGADNVKVIEQAGGMPVMLPYFLDQENIAEIANRIDGLYATGGYDIDPTLFGEEPHPNLGMVIPMRDQFEIALIKMLLEMNKPILGVCRGCQIVNVAAGGDMYQDIYSQVDSNLLQHQQKAPKYHCTHFVHVQKDTLLHKLTASEKIKVNSRHHQANRAVPDSFLVSAKASDGILEAIESKHHRFVLGLQWHPENLAANNDETSLKIYRGFIEACKQTN